ADLEGGTETRMPGAKRFWGARRRPRGDRKTGPQSKAPAGAGLGDDAGPRGTAVPWAGAGRSAGVTTAMTYELRVGTSICDNADRSNKKPSATVTFGDRAARIRKRLDGIWGKTMVFTSPIRRAIIAASG